jgi:LPS O-antigen subunit length determinant protein (WzzB/FepE family)
MLERGRLSTALNALDAEKPSLMQKLTRPLTQPTELMGEITAPTKPAKPKKALVLALSVVLGLMGGVMLAFVAEFAAKARGTAAAPASVR